MAFERPDYWPNYKGRNKRKAPFPKPVTHIALEVWSEAQKPKKSRGMIGRIRCLLWALENWNDDGSEWSQTCKRMVELALKEAGVKIEK